MVEFKDYYKTLEINKNASPAEIKSAYKKLAKQHHPDSTTGTEAKFKEIQEAYEVLKDPSKKNHYDAMASTVRRSTRPYDYRSRPMYSQSGSFSDYVNQANKGKSSNPDLNKGAKFSDFFEMLFGQYNQQQQPSATVKPTKGDDYEMSIDLSLEEAHTGTLRKIEITSNEQNTRRLEVKVPAGVRNGNKIKVSKEGKQGKHGGEKGDLFLKIKINEHPFFWIEDNSPDDINCQLRLRPAEAVIGCVRKIPTLTGKVDLTIPPLTQNNQILRLRAKGLKSGKSEVFGDQYVHILLEIPSNPSPDELELYQELAKIEEKKAADSN